MFNACVAFVLDRPNDNQSSYVFASSKKFGFKISNDTANVLSFLDVFFRGKFILQCLIIIFVITICVLYAIHISDKGKTKQVDVAPDSTGQNQGKRTIRMRWKRVYKGYYLPACERLGQSSVEYNRFCEIRREHRPNYTRHRKVTIVYFIVKRKIQHYVL